MYNKVGGKRAEDRRPRPTDVLYALHTIDRTRRSFGSRRWGWWFEIIIHERAGRQFEASMQSNAIRCENPSIRVVRAAGPPTCVLHLVFRASQHLKDSRNSETLSDKRPSHARLALVALDPEELIKGSCKLHAGNATQARTSSLRRRVGDELGLRAEEGADADRRSTYFVKLTNMQ